MLKWSKECLSFSYDEESGVVYRLLDFLGAVGYRVGTDGSVWSRWRRMPQRGSGKGPGSISVLSDSWECFTNRRTGYRQVQLSLESGEIGRFLVHRLVLQSFTGPCPEGMQCRHLDTTRENNDLANLSWGTWEEDWDDRRRHGKHQWESPKHRGELHSKAKLTEDEVLEIRRLYAAGGHTHKMLAIKYGVAVPSVACIIKRRSWKHVS